MRVRRGDNFARRLLVSVDAKGYGSGDDQWHLAVQRLLPRVLDEAAAAAKLNRRRWRRSPRGDGELAVLPESEPEARVVDAFVPALCDALEHHNRGRVTPTRLRLRLAIHYGVAIPASNGFAGQAVVAVSRLVDGEPLRVALTVSRRDLAVLLSQQVYTDAVAQGHTMLPPAEFRRVAVDNKEFHEDAWLYVPGCDAHSLELGDSSDKARSTTSAPQRTNMAAPMWSSEITAPTNPAPTNTWPPRHPTRHMGSGTTRDTGRRGRRSTKHS